jgi:hypothetical protein
MCFLQLAWLRVHRALWERIERNVYCWAGPSASSYRLRTWSNRIRSGTVSSLGTGFFNGRWLFDVAWFSHRNSHWGVSPCKPQVAQTTGPVKRIIGVRPHIFAERMKRRSDSTEGKRTIAARFATVDPVFGNLRHNK